MTKPGQVTELWRYEWNNLRPIFNRSRAFHSLTDLYWLEWTLAHGLGQNMTASDLCYCLLTILMSFEITDLDWHRAFLQWQNLSVWSFLEVLKAKMRFVLFHIGMFVGNLDRFRCQSGPLTQFALRRFSSEADVVFFQNTIHHSCKYIHPGAEIMCDSIYNWTGNMLVKVSFRYH